jgi:triacylglycerol lipase
MIQIRPSRSPPPLLPQLACGQGELVYLLHGFAGLPLWMHRLARFLRRQNYMVRAWGYSSVRTTIAQHTTALRRDLAGALADSQFQRLHFITHSAGSIIVRNLLREACPRKLGRVVMLAPPNSGSHIAWALSRVLGWLCPILREISTAPGSYVNRLGPPPQTEIGIIAASHDWMVRRCNTHLQTQRDHIVIRGDHVRLPLLREAAEQAIYFLATGTFRHPGREASDLLVTSRR